MRFHPLRAHALSVCITAIFFTGCPPTEPVDGGPGDGDGDGDGDDDTIEAVITVEQTVPLGGELALSAQETLNPAGRALTYAWSVVDEPEAGCAGAFVPSATEVDVVLTPSCLGEYRVLLDVGTVTDTEPVSSVFATITVIRPDNHIVVIAPVDETVLSGFPVALDGSGTIAASEETLSFAWSAQTEQADCPTGGFDDDTSATPVFTPACSGMHTFTLTVSDSISSNTGTLALSVQPSLVVSFGMVMEAPFPSATRVSLLLDEESIPPGRAGDVTFDLVATSIDDAAEATVSVDADDAQAYDVTPGSPRAGYTLSATATLDGVTTLPAATQVLNVPNAPPTVEVALYAPFDTGDIVTASAAVADADGDTVTCTASLLDAQMLPVTAPPSITSAMVVDEACVVVVDTVGASDAAWSLRVDVEDGMGGSAFSIASFVPENEAPVIQPITVAPVGYSCDGTSCATEAVVIAVDAMDSNTDVADLTFAVGLDSSPPAVSGVTLEATPTGPLGEFSLVLSRPNLGAMTSADANATYTLTVTVTDLPIADGLEAAQGTESFTLRVETAPPIIADISLAGAAPIDHTYDTASAEYRAAASTTWTTTDPEGNTVTTSAAITACPAAGCSNSTLVITAGDGSDGSLDAGLAASVISDVVGGYTITIDAVDADGETATSTVDYTVTNRGPAVTGGFSQTVFHTYQDTRYLMTLPYGDALAGASDPDGDPLVYDQLVMECPPGTSSVTDGSGFTCNGDDFGFFGGNIVFESLTPGHVDNVTYTLTGTVSDGLATAGPPLTLHSWTAVDRAPVFSNTFSAGNESLNHRYNDGEVELETPLRLGGVVADPDGDPMTPRVTVTNDSCTTTASWVVENETMDMQFSCPWATRSVVKTVVPGVSTVFGDVDENDSFTIRLENRLPVVNSVEWRHQDGASPSFYAYFPPGNGGNSTPYFERHLSVNESGQDKARQYQKDIDYSHLDSRCTQPNFWFPGGPFALALDATDPDGDPLEAGFNINCGANQVFRPEPIISGNNCTGIDFEATSTLRPVPSTGLFPFQVMRPSSETDEICFSSGVFTYRQQDLFDNHPTRNAVQCTVQTSSRVTDGWSSQSTSIASMQRYFDWSNVTEQCF